MEDIDIIIEAVIWDDWNIMHIARHHVTPNEVESALSDENAVYLKAKLGRVMVLGGTGERLLTTVLNEQAVRGVFYVITARDMSKKERAYYRVKNK